jgi:hypothetical protein
LGDGNPLWNVTTKTSELLIDQDLNSRIRSKKKHNLWQTIYDAIPLNWSCPADLLTNQTVLDIAKGTATETFKFFCLPFSNPDPALRHSQYLGLSLPVTAESGRHFNSSRLVVKLLLPLPGARHRSGGPAHCGQAAAGPPGPAAAAN